ncbi:hypothetical protein GEMRC1_013883 [Eukaryota sp. GEM-RC1]
MSSLSSYCGVNLKSVCLFLDDSFKGTDLLNFTSIVSELRLVMKPDVTEFDFLIPSSPLYFSNLKVLNVDTDNSITFDSLCSSLEMNSTVEVLILDLVFLTKHTTNLLSNVFSNNNSIKSVSISTLGNMLCDDNEVKPLFETLSTSKSLSKIDLSGWFLPDSSVILPLFKSLMLKSLVCPPCNRIVDPIYSALKNNTNIKELTFVETTVNTLEIADALQSNTYLKKLEIFSCDLSYSPLFEFLSTNHSLLELVLRNDSYSFSDDEVHSLVEMVQVNSTLLVLTIGGILCYSPQFCKVLQALVNDSGLKKVTFQFLDLSVLVFLYGILATTKLKASIDVTPHFIDVNHGVFAFAPKVSCKILREEITSLESFLSTFEIKELTLKCRFSDEAIIFLCELIKVSSSLTSIDLSGCSLSDFNLARVITALHCNSSLTNVNLGSNGNRLFKNRNILDEDVRSSAENIVKSSTVIELDFD